MIILLIFFEQNKLSMIKKESNIIPFAMEYGAVLSLFLISKFGITVLSSTYLLLNILNIVMICMIPWIVYKYVKKYRTEYASEDFSFSHAFSVAFMIIVFASLPESLVQFVYFQFVNPDFISSQMSSVTDMLTKLNETENSGTLSQLANTFSEAAIPSPSQMVFQNIFNNLYVGGIISLLVAQFTKSKRIK